MATEAQEAAKAKQAASKKVAPYVPRGLELVLLRNNFYQKNYRRMVSVSILLTFIIAGLVGFIFYQYYTRPLPKYFATTEDGKILVLDELSKPSKTQVELFTWAKEAAQAAFTYDFQNYREEIQASKIYFTANGHTQLRQAIKESRNLEAVIKKKMTTQVIFGNNPPEIVKQGVLNGRYTWILKFPMQIVYRNSNPMDTIVQNVIVTMTVSRVPIWDSSMGIGIRSLVVREIIPPNQQGKSQGTGQASSQAQGKQ